MTTSTSTSARLTDRINVEATEHTHGGVSYVVTTGTGENSYGPEGECAFAYFASDVAEWLDAHELEPTLSYTDDFCAALDPEDDRDLACYLAARGLRLTRGGACTPVLTDAEYSAIQAAMVEVAS